MLSSGAIDFEPDFYVQTADGFLTAMHATAPTRIEVHKVVFFHPGEYDGLSVLRLVNS